MRRNLRVDWGVLRSEVEGALQRCGLFPAAVRIDGRLNRLGAGLNHKNFAFRLNATGPSPGPKAAVYVLRKLARDQADASYEESVGRLQREAGTLQALASQPLDFVAPRFVCFVGESDAPPRGMIETALFGLPCEHMVSDKNKGNFLIELIARSAEAIHRVPVDGFCCLPHHPDSRSHILTELDDVVSAASISEDSDVAACVEWIRHHLPKSGPSVLLHGDLLPQNLLWRFEEHRPGVVDWEFAQIGDPAYDLAIVTRGNRRLFGLANALARLVDAYHQAGGEHVTTSDVMSHELIMVLRWLGHAIRCEREGRREGHPPAFYRKQLRAILRRTAGLTRDA